MGASKILWLILLLICPIFIDCSAQVDSHQREVGFASISFVELRRSTPDELRDLVEELGVEGAEHDELRQALRALEEIERTEGEGVELTIWQAQITFYLLEPLTNEMEVIRWSRRGENLAERIREAAPERVEGYYFGAVFLGLRANHQRVRAVSFLDDLEELGRRAVEIDETYDDAGPLRFMGMLLINAPAWPFGPGDTEEGVELLQRAADLNEYPLNNLLLAQGLVENGDETAACQVLTESADAPREGRWARTSSRWRLETEQLAAEISCQLNAPPGLAQAH